MASASITVLIALLAAFAGAAVAWLIARTRQAAQRGAAEERALSQSKLVIELELRLRATEETREQARAALADAQARIASLETTLAHERRANEEKLAAITDAHARLTTEFKALSSDALKSNNTAFLELAREAFGKLQQQSSGDLEKRQQAVEALVKPIRESLDKVDTKIGEIEKSRASAYGQLSEQLKSLGTAQTSLQAEAAKLSTALRSTTTAGTWGELQLRRVIELSGMSSYCDFTEQQSSGPLRADVVVRLPGGQQIVIDAKAPNDAYREAVNTPDESVRVAKLAEHAAKVRTHIDSLGGKDYWAQFQPSPEFVVLFLPGDQFLSGALQGDPGLIDRAIAKKVLLATPATLIALLKAAAYGWRQEAISKNAEEIGALGRELHERLATFAEHLHKVGRNLDAAVRGYNSAVGSFETGLLPQARRFVELGAKGNKELPQPDVIDSAPREVTKRM